MNRGWCDHVASISPKIDRFAEQMDSIAHAGSSPVVEVVSTFAEVCSHFQGRLRKILFPQPGIFVGTQSTTTKSLSWLPVITPTL